MKKSLIIDTVSSVEPVSQITYVSIIGRTDVKSLVIILDSLRTIILRHNDTPTFGVGKLGKLNKLFSDTLFSDILFV